jgi:hypothetical protein
LSPWSDHVGAWRTVSDCAVDLAMHVVGVRESGSNRGAEVDYWREDGGGKTLPAGESGPPWCAYFRSSLLQELRRRGWDLDYMVRSGAARSHYQRAPLTHLVPCHRLLSAIDHAPELLLGGAMVRSRSGKPHQRDIILSGGRCQGHVATVVGITNDGGLLCVGGNSSGVGHSRVRGSGSVALEVYTPGTKHWDCIAGVSTLRSVALAQTS